MVDLIKPVRWWRSVLARAGGRGEFTVDMFAGGGGTSKGIEGALGSAVDIAINHDAHAIEIHKANHPKTYHFLTDVREVDPRQVLADRPVGLLWLSPDCTHHSRAKGGKPVKRNRRALANVGIVWAETRRPRVIILENVQEFEDWGPLGDDNTPDKARAGQSFKRWCAKLRRLGYQVEHRALVAADYGAPTIRKRLFLIARRDGKPIVWPKPTHCQSDRAHLLGLQPWRAAYECIDWAIPCPSIFERKRPLAEATLRRVHAGVFKFVFSGDPFIVTPGHQGAGFRGQSVREPMATVTASRDFGAVVAPVFAGVGGRAGQSPSRPLTEPLRTATGKADEGLVTASLVAMGYGEAEGQAPRVMDIAEPSNTVTSGGKKAALLKGFLVGAGGPSHGGKPRSGSVPMGTLLTENHQAITTAHLTTFRGTSKAGRDMRDPVPAITGQGLHVGEVRAFLVKYFRTGVPTSVRKPMPTLSTKHRLGLVEVRGELYQLWDLGLRMLTPRELLRAQFGKYAEGYILLGNQAQQVKAIGNSVAPEVAEALVRANYKADEVAAEAVA